VRDQQNVRVCIAKYKGFLTTCEQASYPLNVISLFIV